ncbi:LysR family transcriptional regulator [Herbaspirillum robiniae]|uniref:LysR family transcriptional regulator n=1 Tax=Herbaspirillum robiniae TaxID=2014887 RepID=A0A246WP91_9BURK|nr:LysR family transcriptional regulator [Herbaspirillum robiniae]OWY28176.1 LysR family transcriptional regulator [Herbaspirillum robiniae]
MSGENFRDIVAFLAVARERSFTRAAVHLGVSQSALSHTIRALEARLGLRLLTRTTRSVSPTEAGERLIQRVAPRFDNIAAELASFAELRDKPSGKVRITASDFAAKTVLWPKLSQLQRSFPDIKIEITIESGLIDIVSENFDAGVRFGDQIAKDMTAVQISPKVRMTIVGAPAYLARHSAPIVPADLTGHACINTRFSVRGGNYAWELRKGRQNLQVRVDGPWTFNSIYPVIDAAVEGFGLAYVPEELARPYLTNGQLQSVMEDWGQTFPGLHIFYASTRRSSRAISMVINALRHTK